MILTDMCQFLAIAIGKKAQDAHDSVRLPIDDVREFL